MCNGTPFTVGKSSPENQDHFNEEAPGVVHVLHVLLNDFVVSVCFFFSNKVQRV